MLNTRSINDSSQSTIKMEKGYYGIIKTEETKVLQVAIHNKNGKGLLPKWCV